MTLSPADLAAYAAHREPVRDDAMAQIHALAREMQEKAEGVPIALQAWEQAKKDLAVVRDDKLPSALKEARVGERGIDVPGVGVVSWKKDVFGSLPSLDERPQERAEALAWLERNAPGLLKRKLTAVMPKTSALYITGGQRFDIEALVTRALPGHDGHDVTLTVGDLLQELVKIIVPGTETDIKPDVPHQSLCKYGREMMEAGTDIPFKLLGLTPVDRAKITAPKKKGI